MTNNFSFEADKETKQIHITREFNAPVERVWKAFTDSKLLDQWWGPKPNRIETRIFEFKVGGTWQFAMVTPEGQKHWLNAEFTGIEDHKAIITKALFFDGDGNPIKDAPNWYRNTTFASIEGNRTRVDVEINFEAQDTFDSFAFGHGGYFKTGTSIGYDQLDELLTAE